MKIQCFLNEFNHQNKYDFVFFLVLRFTFSERLNSLFETTPSFSISEDITLDSRSVNSSVRIHPSFQVFASIHAEAGQLINISPATKSRFTIIHVPAYSEEDLKLLIENYIANDPKLLDGYTSKSKAVSVSKTIVDLIFSIRESLRNDTGKVPNDMHSLFRLAEFICDQLKFTREKKASKLELSHLFTININSSFPVLRFYL